MVCAIFSAIAHRRENVFNPKLFTLIRHENFYAYNCYKANLKKSQELIFDKFNFFIIKNPKH